MKQTNNEKGYALLIVLLLIVFITTLTAVFLRGSISNAKQEKKVDNSHLTVSVAEMGVEYYSTKYSNEYFYRSEEIKKWAENEIETHRLKNASRPPNERTDFNYTALQEKAVNKLYERLTGFIVPIKSDFKIDEVDRFFFKLVPASKSYGELKEKQPINGVRESRLTNQNNIIVDLLSDGKSIEVFGEVEGITIGDERKSYLTFHQIFKVPSFNPADSESNGEESEEEDKNEGKGENWLEEWSYPQNVSADACSPQDGTITNTKCIEDNKVNKIKKLENKAEVYFPKGITYNGTTQFDVQGSSIFLGSIFDVGSHGVKLQKSTMKINDSLTSKGKVELQGSNLLVNGGLNSESFEVQDNDNRKSTVQIKNSLNVSGKTSMQNSSLVVNGAFNASGKTDIQNTNIKVDGEFSSSENLKIQGKSNKHNMQVEKNAMISGENELQDVNFFVGETLMLSGRSKIKGSSKVCVATHAMISEEFELDENSFLYYGSSLQYTRSDKVKGTIRKLEPSEFSSLCPRMPFENDLPVDIPGGPSEGSLKWPTPSLNVEYLKKSEAS